MFFSRWKIHLLYDNMTIPIFGCAFGDNRYLGVQPRIAAALCSKSRHLQRVAESLQTPRPPSEFASLRGVLLLPAALQTSLHHQSLSLRNANMPVYVRCVECRRMVIQDHAFTKRCLLNQVAATTYKVSDRGTLATSARILLADSRHFDIPSPPTYRESYSH